MTSDGPVDFNLLQRVFDYLNDGLYITDVNRVILVWNKRAAEITGYPLERVRGHACRDGILNHVDKNGIPMCSTDLCPLHRAIVTHTASRSPSLIYAKTAERGRIPVSVSVSSLEDEQGEVIGGIEMFRDESGMIRDLEFAQRIQRTLLQTKLPSHRELDISVKNYPCDIIGGDFFDVYEIAPEVFGIIVADVRGHGISAALYTTVLKSIVQAERALSRQPGKFLAAVNQALAQVTIDEVFASAFYFVVSSIDGKLSYANAGHPFPLLQQAGGAIVELAGGDMPLGFLKDAEYHEFTAELQPGETLLVFTDGAIEIMGVSGELLGQQGLMAIMAELDWRFGKPALTKMYDRLVASCAEVQLADDLLLLSCHRKE